MKKKINEFIKENKYLIITFLLSSIVIMILYTLKHIAPFGNNSMLDVDFYHQYGPLLNELYDRIKSGETLLYSFNTGGGVPFYRNLLNYLSSPFNVILFLFKKENIVMAFSIIIGLKAILASVTMAFYLKKTFKNNNYLIVIFGLFYAFSGYFCAYYWNIMWLDGMVFLPLIMYGINKIVDDNKPMFYIINLSIMLVANYFIAYMICLFSVLYFLGYTWYRYGFKFKIIVKKILIFALSSILAAGLVAFLLLPLYYSLSSISATNGSFPTVENSFSVTNYIFNHLSGVSRTVFASDPLPLPNVYPGLLTLIGIILLFLNKNINKKEKILSIIALLIFFFSFIFTPIDYVWHAFHVPNDLPWRYSFIYVFVLIVIGYYSVSRLKEVNIIKLSISFAILILITLIASKTGFENINDTKTIICFILLVCYFILCLLIKETKYKKISITLLFVLAMAECIYGININWNIDHDIKTFMQDKKPYQVLINKARKDDNGLYRMEKTGYITLNDGAWYDYYGVSTFSSMAYEDTSKFQRKLGMAGNDINSYYYQHFQTPVYNTMFNVKYLMGEYIKNDYYVPIENYNSYNLTGYNYSSSLVYMLNNSIKKWVLEDYKPFENQSEFVYKGTGEKNVFEPLKVSKLEGGKINEEEFNKNSNGSFTYNLNDSFETLSFIIKNDKEQNIYIYLGGDNIKSFSINGKYYSLTSDEFYILDAGKLLEGDVKVIVTFKNSDSSNIKFYAYTINDEIFKKFYKKLDQGILNVTKYNETHIEGTIIAKKEQTAFTTISYDEGWKVYVDNKIVKTNKIANAFLNFDVPKGNHNIKLIYYPKGMREGFVISMISLMIFILYFGILEYIKQKKYKKDEFIV